MGGRNSAPRLDRCAGSQGGSMIDSNMKLGVRRVVKIHIRHAVLVWWERWRPNPWGLIIGGLLFIAASTPSLLPRTYTYQGIANGLSGVSGYAFGIFAHWNWRTWLQDVVILLWHKLRDAWQLPDFRPPHYEERARVWFEIAFTAVTMVVLIATSVNSVRWQHQLFGYMGMEEPSWIGLFIAGPLGIAVWLGVLYLCHLIMVVARFIAKITPDSWTVSAQTFVTWVLVVSFALWSVKSLIPGAVVRGTNHIFDTQNRTYDDYSQVHRWQRSGSPQSLNSWGGLGAAGARFVSGGLHRTELEELTGRTSLEPIRLYSGLGNAASDQERAALLVGELERTHAQDRAAIMVVGTTGTGWANPTAVQAFELLYDGDTATIATQYSYFPSPIQFVSDTDHVRESGRILVGAVLDWWHGLPEENRPELYIFGESLGSTQTEGAFSGIRDISNSVDGIFWVGPPNGNQLWRTLVDRRDVGSREVTPEYSGGQMVRFAQDGNHIDVDEQWQRPRVLYLQHPSDPIVWWSPSLIWREPDWLKEPAGVGRHPEMVWRPYVTFWQVSLDLLNSVAVPDGFGHNYGTEVLDGLVAITGFDGDVEQLREELVTAKRITGD